MPDASAPTDPIPPTAPGPPWPDRDAAAGDPSLSSGLYRGIVRWTCWLVRAYYRLHVRGAEFNRDSPTLLVQNHTNGLVDAHLVMVTTPRPIRILVKYQLMTTPLLGWILRTTDAVPMYRKKDGIDTRHNMQSFHAVDEALRVDRSVIALFPEGESLNSVGLRSLRTGVARMAINAEESVPGGIGLQIVPVGATFERRDRIRTDCELLIGEPMNFNDFLEEAAERGLEDRPRINWVVKRIAQHMRCLILDAKDEEEHEAALALARLMPREDRPLGILRQEALTALRTRSGEGEDGERRRELVTQLGQRLEAARLTGDEVLAPAPTAFATWRPILWLVPLLAVFALVMGLPYLLGRQIGRLHRSPDKLVSLRCMFAFATTLFWHPTLVVGGGLAFGAVGAATAAVLVALGLATHTSTLDGWLAFRRALAHRQLERSGEGSTLLDAIRMVRASYGVA